MGLSLQCHFEARRLTCRAEVDGTDYAMLMSKSISPLTRDCGVPVDLEMPGKRCLHEDLADRLRRALAG